jgi:DNA-binding transcriptional MerR regulator
MEKPKIYLAAADAARILGVTPAAVRQMNKRGELFASARTAGGVFLFAQSEVERLKAKREQRRASGGR